MNKKFTTKSDMKKLKWKIELLEYRLINKIGIMFVFFVGISTVLIKLQNQ